MLSLSVAPILAGRAAPPAPPPQSGSVELISGDLGSKTPSLDNIKGKWSQAFKLLGNAATVTAEYDRAENDKFLKSASLSGAVDKIKYELASSFGGGPLEATLETSTEDGTTIEVEAEVDGLSSRVTRVTGTRTLSVNERECDLELSHTLGDNESKLRLSTMLGSGLRAVGLLSSKGGGKGGLDHSLTYELEYDTQLTEGRTLSAKVSPRDGTGEVEYEDSATIDATIAATFPLGGAPKVTAKRAFSF
jgi:hypothetical protein|mmetsp:Transcript_7216/g.21610  ORF Transcript_7216/g.21610 Transcript_7216/m.21610 type:complete len:248 (+) Transcript_7216:41-784(+)